VNLKDTRSPSLLVQKAEGSTGMDSVEVIRIKPPMAELPLKTASNSNPHFITFL